MLGSLIPLGVPQGAAMVSDCLPGYLALGQLNFFRSCGVVGPVAINLPSLIGGGPPLGAMMAPPVMSAPVPLSLPGDMGPGPMQVPAPVPASVAQAAARTSSGLPNFHPVVGGRPVGGGVGIPISVGGGGGGAGSTSLLRPVGAPAGTVGPLRAPGVAARSAVSTATAGRMTAALAKSPGASLLMAPPKGTPVLSGLDEGFLDTTMGKVVLYGGLGLLVLMLLKPKGRRGPDLTIGGLHTAS